MKIMVLGGGNCQINLIKRLKDKGDEIILIDYLSNCLGKSVCNKHYQISTFDTPKVLEIAKTEKIDAIVTLGTDQPIYTAAVVAKECGLPFYLNPEEALSVTNKRVMKKMFKEYSIPSANYVLISESFKDEEVNKLKFPCVLKPVDSQGQRGIYKLNSIAEIRAVIKDTLSYSREDKVLLEEYYDSDEITVNGWITNGKLTLLSVVDRVTLQENQHIGICIAHNFPSQHLKRYYQDIENLTQKVIQSFNLTNGPVYFQYLIGEKGLQINEIAMRIGGAYEDITLPLITGIDVLDVLIQSIKGNKIDASKFDAYQLSQNQVYLSTQMFFLNKGCITNIFYDQDSLSKARISHLNIARHIGDQIRDIQNATARAGYFLVQANTVSELKLNIQRAYQNVKIMDDKKSNLIKNYFDYQDRYKYAPTDL